MLNWMVWNGTEYLHKKIDSALNNQQRLICQKKNKKKQKQPIILQKKQETKLREHVHVYKSTNHSQMWSKGSLLENYYIEV